MKRRKDNFFNRQLPLSDLKKMLQELPDPLKSEVSNVRSMHPIIKMEKIKKRRRTAYGDLIEVEESPTIKTTKTFIKKDEDEPTFP
jgi:hypothetical protein